LPAGEIQDSMWLPHDPSEQKFGDLGKFSHCWHGTSFTDWSKLGTIPTEKHPEILESTLFLQAKANQLT
jgi:hypothetical protein